jgi:CheY-like chemotaxis protein
MKERRPKILVVDDELELTSMLCELLKQEGFECVTANSGHEMLGVLEKSSPELIVIDYMMPAFNGVEAITAIRGNSKFRGLPVILMSASKEPSARPSVWDSFLPKPFSIESFVGAVRKQLSGKGLGEGKRQD